MLKALKKTIIRPDKTIGMDQETEKEHVSILMNKKRQEILQFIFKYPCIHLHGIARKLGFSINATRWHLRKLMDMGYLNEYKFSNRKVYYPNNSLRELDIQLLGLLNDKKIGPLFKLIYRNPGIIQCELCNRLGEKQSTIVDRLNQLGKFKLIYSLKDGLYRRYYSTQMINSREKLNRKPLKKYRQFLLLILEQDGVEPEILRTTDKNFHIQIKSGDGTSDLIFYFNPYDRFLSQT
jgi:predicted transcriptional regulator